MAATIHYISPVLEQRRLYLVNLRTEFLEDVQNSNEMFKINVVPNKEAAFKFQIVHEYITNIYDFKSSYFKMRHIIQRSGYSDPNDAAWLMDNVPKNLLIFHCAYNEFYCY